MLDKRIETLKTKLTRKPSKLDVKQRHPILLSIEGWYSVESTLDDIPKEYQQHVTEYRNSGTKLKFTRWLSKYGNISEKCLSQLGSYLKPVTFKISCRHNDLLRLADTCHYQSCFKQWRGIQQLRYLADPDIAVVYVPDNSGKYRWRSLLRLMDNPVELGEYVFAIHRPYGNSNVAAIYRKLNELYPLYVQSKRPLRFAPLPIGNSTYILSSATKHENIIVGKHVWSDHWCELDMETHKLKMCCTKYNTGEIYA